MNNIRIRLKEKSLIYLTTKSGAKRSFSFLLPDIRSSSMTTLKKRILQNISQTETSNEPTTLVLDLRTKHAPIHVSKVRLVEFHSTYPRLNQFVERLKTLKTLRDYNEHLVQLTDRLILFRHHIDDCLT